MSFYTTLTGLTGAQSDISATSNNIRSIAASGEETNVIDFVTIASTGNATDFGALTNKRAQFGGCNSYSHGGLAQ